MEDKNKNQDAALSTDELVKILIGNIDLEGVYSFVKDVRDRGAAFDTLRANFLLWKDFAKDAHDINIEKYVKDLSMEDSRNILTLMQKTEGVRLVNFSGMYWSVQAFLGYVTGLLEQAHTKNMFDDKAGEYLCLSTLHSFLSLMVGMYKDFYAVVLRVAERLGATDTSSPRHKYCYNQKLRSYSFNHLYKLYRLMCGLYDLKAQI